jgi:hypothetical protein
MTTNIISSLPYSRNNLLVASLALSWDIRKGEEKSYKQILSRAVNAFPHSVQGFYKNAQVHEIVITLLPVSKKVLKPLTRKTKLRV